MAQLGIKCPVCGHVYPPEYIANPYKGQGICDWCALGIEGMSEPVTRVIPATTVHKPSECN